MIQDSNKQAVNGTWRSVKTTSSNFTVNKFHNNKIYNTLPNGLCPDKGNLTQMFVTVTSCHDSSTPACNLHGRGVIVTVPCDFQWLQANGASGLIGYWCSSIVLLLLLHIGLMFSILHTWAGAQQYLLQQINITWITENISGLYFFLHTKWKICFSFVTQIRLIFGCGLWRGVLRVDLTHVPNFHVTRTKVSVATIPLILVPALPFILTTSWTGLRTQAVYKKGQTQFYFSPFNVWK